MKKTVLLFVLAITGLLTVQAQEEGFVKGDIFISGSAGYSSEDQGTEESSSFIIAPRIGYFVSENIAIGAVLGYSSQKVEEELSGAEIKTNTTNLGAFGRYYFSPASKFSLFGELGIAYVSTELEAGGADVTLDGFGINVGPGIGYFLNSNFALEAYWGALNYTSLSTDGFESKSFSIGADLVNINLGLIYKF